jgi:hypothetical protein
MYCPAGQTPSLGRHPGRLARQGKIRWLQAAPMPQMPSGTAGAWRRAARLSHRRDTFQGDSGPAWSCHHHRDDRYLRTSLRFLAGFPVMSGLSAGTQCELSFFTIAWPGMSPGLIPEKRLRTEVFPGFFTYEENREYWASIQRGLLEDRPSKKLRRFARIANEELRRARAGPGLTISLPSEDALRIRSDREPRWRLRVLAVTAAAGFGLLLSRHRSYSERSDIMSRQIRRRSTQATPRL